jgi:hypothetical protein
MADTNIADDDLLAEVERDRLHQKIAIWRPRRRRRYE